MPVWMQENVWKQVLLERYKPVCSVNRHLKCTTKKKNVSASSNLAAALWLLSKARSWWNFSTCMEN